MLRAYFFLFAVFFTVNISGQKLIYESEYKFRNNVVNYHLYTNSFSLKNGEFLLVEEKKESTSPSPSPFNYNSFLQAPSLLLIGKDGKLKRDLNIHKSLKETYKNVDIRWVEDLNDEFIGVFFTVKNKKLKKRSFYLQKLSKNSLKFEGKGLLLDESTLKLSYYEGYHRLHSNSENQIIFQYAKEIKNNVFIRNIAFNLKDFSIKKQIYTRKQEKCSLTTGIHINKSGVIFDFFLCNKEEGSSDITESYFAIGSNETNQIVKKDIDFVPLNAKFIEFENGEIVINIAVNFNLETREDMCYPSFGYKYLPYTKGLFHAKLDVKGNFTNPTVSSILNENIQHMPLGKFKVILKNTEGDEFYDSKSRYQTIEWMGGKSFKLSNGKLLWVSETTAATLIHIYSKEGDFLSSKIVDKGHASSESGPEFNTRKRGELNKYYFSKGYLKIFHPDVYMKKVGYKYFYYNSINLSVVDIESLLKMKKYDVTETVAVEKKQLDIEYEKFNRTAHFISTMYNEKSGKVIMPVANLGRSSLLTFKVQ
tara:strand:- start:50 stop:1654 length:1605 start_codon:yes stop_codon:yes gene_type:complete